MHEHEEPLRAIIYGKGDMKQIFYGHDQTSMIHMLQEKMQQNPEALVDSKVYIGKKQEESGRYGDYSCFDIKTGKDITPIYLTLPSVKDEGSFKKMIGQLKAQGAKFNFQKNMWYITRQMDQSPFADFLPTEKRESLLSKLDQKKDRAATGRNVGNEKHENRDRDLNER